MGDDPLGVACAPRRNQERNAKKNMDRENTAVGQLQPASGGEGYEVLPPTGKGISPPSAGARNHRANEGQTGTLQRSCYQLTTDGA